MTSEIVTALVTFLVTGGPIAWLVTWRKDRREQSTGQVDVVLRLNGEVEKLQGRVVALFDEVDAARTETSATRRMVDRLTDRLAVLVPAFRDVLDWLDEGMKGQPPHVSAEVRRLLEDDHTYPPTP